MSSRFIWPGDTLSSGKKVSVVRTVPNNVVTPWANAPFRINPISALPPPMSSMTPSYSPRLFITPTEL